MIQYSRVGPGGVLTSNCNVNSNIHVDSLPEKYNTVKLNKKKKWKEAYDEFKKQVKNSLLNV